MYICTAAARQYAEAIWTLLDPEQSVFLFQELSWRLLSVPPPEKKDLLNVLRLRAFEEDMDGALVTNQGKDMARVGLSFSTVCVWMCDVMWFSCFG